MTEPAERERQILTNIGVLISEAAELRNEQHPSVPFVTGWTLAYEFESTELEQTQHYGGGVLSPETQTAAMTRGLFMYGVDRYRVKGH